MQFGLGGQGDWAVGASRVIKVEVAPDTARKRRGRTARRVTAVKPVRALGLDRVAGGATGAALVLAFVLSLQRPGRQLLRAQLRLAVLGQRGRRGAAGAGHRGGGAAAGRAAARGKFGSRLLIKLAGIFALVGLLPGLVIYTVSYQFVSRSIEAWFDVKVAGALDAGLALGKGTLEALAGRPGGQDPRGRRTAGRQRRGRGAAGPGAPARADRRQRGQPGHRQRPGAADGRRQRPPPARPSGPRLLLLRQARKLGTASQVEGPGRRIAGPDAAGPRIRGAGPRAAQRVLLAAGEERFLMVVQPIHARWPSMRWRCRRPTANTSSARWRRDSLRRMYIGTLTLALILAVFGAVLLAIVLGNQLAKPLLLLADGVRQVARGDLTAKPVFASATNWAA
jgi:hypothetical protein